MRRAPTSLRDAVVIGSIRALLVMGAVLIASTALPAPEANPNIEHGYIEETHP